ncbi:hypothetical protein AB0469_37770 [Streptomyces sp. NPDC093801]|uniref:ABC transporter substrate-binding protein n=1 Tax=Streptomyces sp. NPDC093801 TaxID=3155203 RepID=UPI003450420B
MTGLTGPGGGAVWRERLYAVATDKDFRGHLTTVLKSTGLTGDQVAGKAARLGGLPLPKATVTATLTRDKLPKLVFVQQLIRVCGVREEDQPLWIEVWHALEEGRAPLGQPQDAVPSPSAPPVVGTVDLGVVRPPNQAPAPVPAPEPVSVEEGLSTTPKTGPDTAEPSQEALPALQDAEHADPATSEQDSSANPATSTSRKSPSKQARRRWLIGLASAAVAGVLVAGGLWLQAERQKDADTRAKETAAQDKAEWRTSHCGTDNAALTTASAWCAGITDGRDGHAVFGKGFEPALAVIDAENQAAVKSGGYVTVALMGPLTQGDKSLTGDRAVHQVEGAAIAQHEANQGGTYPKIRMVLANMGTDETSWPTVVDRLKTMTGGSDHLVAVTGMGLSQKESIDAARSLSKASIPMVGDLITADGFDTTGAIDGNGAIDGLVRIAPNTSTQLQAIAQELHKHPELKTAALVSAPTTPNGTTDFYTQSQEAAVRNPATGLLPYLQAGGISFRFDARNDAVRTSLNTISNNLCGKVEPDLVFYAGRANRLGDFLEDLRQRPCHTTPITVVTGSDAATLDRSLPALKDPEAPISVLYVPLADPAQLADGTNPDHGLFQGFADEFGRDHHGQQFDKGHLASGWAVMAHDAVLTASLAIRKAVDTPQTPPSVHAVAAQLYLFDSTNVIRGASGVFRIDPQTGNRKSTHEPQVVRLGAPPRN